MKILNLLHPLKLFGKSDVTYGIPPLGAMLLLALISIGFSHVWSQAFGLILMFVCLFMRLGLLFWPLALLWHWLPLLFSAEALDGMGISPKLIYYVAQSAPLYALLRPFEDPWVGEWIYGDSPFHFGAEPWYTYELWYVYLPLAALLLLFRGQKSV